MSTSPSTHSAVRRRTSIPIVATLIASVIGTGVTGSLCIGQRERLEKQRGTAVNHQANLSNLNSFALGLLLGGLRGPLVMALWTSSENQKTEHDLEDFDTKVELIRLLQPEFDTVHLFQIWNKAYNISVQMSNVPNKYTTILDALDYAFSVDAERPDDINIIAAIGGLYFDKFGGSTERFYYSPRIRDESRQDEPFVHVAFDAEKLPDVLKYARLSAAPGYTLIPRDAGNDGSRLMVTLRQSVADDMAKRLPVGIATFELQTTRPVARHDAAGRRLEQDTVLDKAGMILPQFLTPRPGLAVTGDAGDGSQLPYLPQFQPFSYGVSPYAFGFNYYKKCQWLQANRGARHAQMADRVLSSRPALALEKWSEEDWYAALRGEIELAGLQVPNDDGKLQPLTSGRLLGDPFPQCPLLSETIAHFDRASAIAKACADEYAVHLKQYPSDELTYRSHIRDVQARTELTAGDALYLRVMYAQGDDRKQLAAQAREHYAKAADLYSRLFFRYFMGDEDLRFAFPQPGMQNPTNGLLPPNSMAKSLVNRTDTDPETGKLRDEDVAPAMERLRARYAAAPPSNSEDFEEIYGYVDRAYARIRALALVH